MSEQIRQANITITIQKAPLEDGSWAAHLIVTGLLDEQMADVAANHMQMLFCGEELQHAHAPPPSSN